MVAGPGYVVSSCLSLSVHIKTTCFYSFVQERCLRKETCVAFVLHSFPVVLPLRQILNLNFFSSVLDSQRPEKENFVTVVVGQFTSSEQIPSDNLTVS